MHTPNNTDRYRNIPRTFKMELCGSETYSDGNVPLSLVDESNKCNHCRKAWI